MGESQIQAISRSVPAPFTHTIQVRWGDCDPAKIAYTGRIPAFALEAIDAWWDHHLGHDWFSLNLDMNLGTPFVHLEVDFRSPVTPRHPLECKVRLVKIGRKSVGFSVEGRQNGVLCFEGSFACVFVVADRFESIEVPENIRATIEPLLSPMDVSR